MQLSIGEKYKQSFFNPHQKKRKTTKKEKEEEKK